MKNKADKNIYVFVYGTLKHGEGNHRLLTKSKFIDTAKIDGFRLFNISNYSRTVDGITKYGGFPLVVESNDFNGYQVSGEVYQVDNDTLVDLDILESNGYMYTREKRKIITTNGKKIKSWIYIYNCDIVTAVNKYTEIKNGLFIGV